MVKKFVTSANNSCLSSVHYSSIAVHKFTLDTHAVLKINKEVRHRLIITDHN